MKENIKLSWVTDFHCVMDNDLDKISGPHHMDDVELLKTFVPDTGLGDTGWLFYEDDEVYTWSRKTPFIARRQYSQ